MHYTISFSLWWTMVKMAIYTQKCEQNDWKLIIGVGGGGIWNKDVLGGKKLKNYQSEGDDYSGLESKLSYHSDVFQ